MTPELWGFRKITTRNYPVLGANASASTQQLNIDLKDFLQKEVVSRLLLRFSGNIVVAGAGAGVATGRDNPEQLITNVILKTSPSLGVISKNNIDPRRIIRMGLFDRGYSIKAATVPDAAATVAVDFTLPLTFKMPGSVNPVEWALPLSMFESAILQITCGTRDQLFTGGTNTWDVSGVQVQVWADYDIGVAGQFHVLEEIQRQFIITANQTDFPLATLESGYIYTHFMVTTERDNVLVNDILNGFYIQSAGRIWTPQGDLNALEIQRWNKETHINNTAEPLVTGVYFIPALRDGMYKRAVDALDARLDVRADVTVGAGTTRVLTLLARRIIPLGLQAVGSQQVPGA